MTFIGLDSVTSRNTEKSLGFPFCPRVLFTTSNPAEADIVWTSCPARKVASAMAGRPAFASKKMVQVADVLSI
jgi:hypothetical protein